MVAFSTISSAAWARQAISFIANSIHGSHGTDEYQRLVLSWVAREPSCQASAAHIKNLRLHRSRHRCRLSLQRVPVLRLLVRSDKVFIAVGVELVEAGPTLRQAQTERFIHHRAGSIAIMPLAYFRLKLLNFPVI